MLSDTVYPVLFGAYSLKQLEGLDEDIDPGRLRWQMEGAEMHLDDVRDADYPKSYTLTSEVPVIPIDELSTRTYDQLYSGSMDDAYIQKPRNFRNASQRWLKKLRLKEILRMRRLCFCNNI